MVTKRSKLYTLILSLTLLLCVGLSVFFVKKPTVAQALTHTGDIEYSNVDLLPELNSLGNQAFPVVEVSFKIEDGFRSKFNAGTINSTRKVNNEHTIGTATIDVRKDYAIYVGLTTRTLTTSSFSDSSISETIKSLTSDMQSSTAYWSAYQAFQHISDVGLGCMPYRATLPSNYVGLSLDSLTALKSFGKSSDNLYKNLSSKINLFVVLFEETRETEDTIYSAEKLGVVPYSAHSYGTLVESINLSQLAKKLADESTYKDFNYYSNLCRWAGYPTKSSADSPATINVISRKMTSATTYENVNTSFTIPWYQGSNEKYVLNNLKSKLGISDVAKFNAVWKDVDVLEDGLVNLNSEKVVYQATGYEYDYNANNFTGTITVEYTDFYAKDFCIMVKSNDATESASIYVYTADIQTVGSNLVLTFDLARIEEQLLNQRGWIIDLTDSALTVTNTSSNVTVETSQDKVIVTVSSENQEDLSHVEIFAVAEIIEDYDVEITYEYLTLKLDETHDVVKSVVESEPISMPYSDSLKLNENNFYVYYGAGIDSAISLDALDGCDYVKYAGVEKTTVSDGKFKFIVKYEFNMILKINQPNGDVIFKPVPKTKSEFALEELGIEIPKATRVSSIEVSDNLLLKRSDENIALSTIEINADTWSDEIGEIAVNVSEEFFVNVNYLEQYKRTPFAYPVTKSGTAKVSEMPISGVSVTEFLKSFLNKTNLKLLKSNVESVDVTFNGYDTYTFDVKYTFASIKKIDYDGKITDEVKIPLTNYRAWTEAFGKDWSLMFLNMPGNVYFEYSQVEAPDGTIITLDNLYGYFAEAVFDENVTDLNYYFKGFSGDGVVSMFEKTETTGGKIYTAIGNLMNRTDNFFIDALSVPILTFCELVNDENVMYHSYFFYLDCSTSLEETFISNGKADSADDEDGAFDNTVDDVVNNLNDGAGGLFVKGDGSWTTFSWILLGVGILILLGVVYKGLRK